MDRRAISISGIVQGVGFRPHVYNLARHLRLYGFVRNVAGGVIIEVEGEPQSLDRFLSELTDRPPPLARIDELHWSSRPPRGDPSFRIEPSEADITSPIFISPDVATCEDCLAELFDPMDRRYRYPFLNCTNCGPRLTIITGAPYDRERTSMAGFAMCPACRAEYEDPSDRRFHAQPTACPSCGPQLELLDLQGQPIPTADPIAWAAEALRQGMIGAIKGLGGYHLACIAGTSGGGAGCAGLTPATLGTWPQELGWLGSSPKGDAPREFPPWSGDPRPSQAVAELRRRKHRDEKPFAVMVADIAAVRAICEVSPAEEALLLSPRRPIVLLRQQADACVALGVSPRNPWLGVMLPYTPLHHLLLRELVGIPLVMTSGNRSDEPIAYEDRDALERLAGIADFFLVHDRPIHLRCDDSVTRVVGGAELPIRRSRGDAPRPISLPIECQRPTLALGGQLKATFAMGRERHAFISHHIGDLDHYAAFRAYVEAIAHYERLFHVKPELLVHDLHADYPSTSYAREHAGSCPTRGVQHHHAHMASCMTENDLNEPVIGVTFDGTGFGTDGTIWGGEFLMGDYRAFRRLAHLRSVAMPGGEQAIHEPWRMAATYLFDSGQDFSMLSERIPAPSLKVIEMMIGRRINAPMTTSAGRLFDAVAALAGVRQQVSYEGQAAIELEWLASEVAADGVYPFDVVEADDENPPAESLVLDMRPMIVEVAGEVRRGVSPSVIARRFHSTIVEMIAQVCSRLRAKTGLDAVVLSGGVFLNALLTVETVTRLANEGFRVYRHRRVPPNDGGISLGQLAVAAARDTTEGGVDVPCDPGTRR